MARRRFPVLLALAADVAVLVVFVLVGRRTHGEDPGLRGFVRVLWPFLLGLGIAWPVLRLAAAPLAWRRALGAAAVTVAVGVALRVTVQGRDLPAAFVVVACTFVGACMVAWRAIAIGVRRVELSRRVGSE